MSVRVKQADEPWVVGGQVGHRYRDRDFGVFAGLLTASTAVPLTLGSSNFLLAVLTKANTPVRARLLQVRLSISTGATGRWAFRISNLVEDPGSAGILTPVWVAGNRNSRCYYRRLPANPAGQNLETFTYDTFNAGFGGQVLYDFAGMWAGAPPTLGERGRGLVSDNGTKEAIGWMFETITEAAITTAPFVTVSTLWVEESPS